MTADDDEVLSLIPGKPKMNLHASYAIYGAGRDLDETFGLVETAEKAAEIYIKIARLPGLNTITDEQMRLLEARFGVRAREGYLSDL